ncbi:alpha/beta hydrolase [Mycolicibacterium komossense]|uniref:Alpha/beta fold hydrolase n=1 Tax=Mycolicibacterium komossense TaxID=1779 RepID=A0ABT3CFF9_9MYCO|nr:alpha/beta hydrolase [Mycolicibacterium komossense]MCV7228218.1 alpha/beta fold hydrolase [Mycolicibacterium komossense]
MNQPITTSRVSFASNGSRCSGWLTLPKDSGPHPGLVLAHGLGATHDMALSQYEQHFARAGVATLAFDYRHTGESAGVPRQHFSMRRHRQDVGAALDYLRGHHSIDAPRVGLWGTSLGAMHVLRVAGARADLAVVVVQCPIVHGPATLVRSGWRSAIRLTPAILDDILRRIRGAGRRYVPIVGEPGTAAAVTISGAADGWYSTVPPDATFDNRIAAADIVAIAATSAKRRAANIAAPLLVCVSQRETLIDPRHAEEIGHRAAHGVVRHYDGDHFQVYHQPLVADLLADQTRFLQEHLNVQNG